MAAAALLNIPRRAQRFFFVPDDMWRRSHKICQRGFASKAAEFYGIDGKICKCFWDADSLNIPRTVLTLDALAAIESIVPGHKVHITAFGQDHKFSNRERILSHKEVTVHMVEGGKDVADDQMIDPVKYEIETNQMSKIAMIISANSKAIEAIKPLNDYGCHTILLTERHIKPSTNPAIMARRLRDHQLFINSAAETHSWKNIMTALPQMGKRGRVKREEMQADELDAQKKKKEEGSA